MTTSATTTATPSTTPTATKAPAKKTTAAPAVAPKSAPAKKAAAKAPATKPAAAPAKPAKPAKAEKPKKLKLVRDSLSIPKEEYEVIAVLKLRAGKLGHAAKKTEIIRAGIKAIAALSDQALLKALKSVPSIKTGRPAKHKGK